MPYIQKEVRYELTEGDIAPWKPGELNFLITRLCDNFLYKDGNTIYSYEDLNEVIGVLECCKLEFYRRLVAPYEDQKMFENGDVYRNGR